MQSRGASVRHRSMRFLLQLLWTWWKQQYFASPFCLQASEYHSKFAMFSQVILEHNAEQFQISCVGFSPTACRYLWYCLLKSAKSISIPTAVPERSRYQVERIIFATNYLKIARGAFHSLYNSWTPKQTEHRDRQHAICKRFVNG